MVRFESERVAAYSYTGALRHATIDP